MRLQVLGCFRGGELQPGEKRSRFGAQDRALRRSEVDRHHQGLRNRARLPATPARKERQFVIRLKCADGAKVPAHWHPTDENLTVLKGTFLVGMGETFDESKVADDECWKFHPDAQGDAAFRA